MEILIEETPNPKALKFICDQAVKTEGKATFKKEDVTDLPLARDLLNIPEVTQVHLYDNVISVSQTGEADWGTLLQAIESVIRTRMPVHDPGFEPQAQSKKPKENLSPEMLQIEEILNRTVRPGLMADGGDIELVSYENDVLVVNFQGACGGCPSSTMGTLYAIEGILQQEFNPNLQVRPNVG
jgi:Fe-S cluster biogenesis protein NfuA